MGFFIDVDVFDGFDGLMMEAVDFQVLGTEYIREPRIRLDYQGVASIAFTESMIQGGGNVEWNGLVIVVDPAQCDVIEAGGTHYTATLAGGPVINGGLFIASIYNNTLNDGCIDTQGGGSGGVTYDSEMIRNASQSLPFRPIAIWHY